MDPDSSELESSILRSNPAELDEEEDEVEEEEEEEETKVYLPKLASI